MQQKLASACGVQGASSVPKRGRTGRQQTAGASKEGADGWSNGKPTKRLRGITRCDLQPRGLLDCPAEVLALILSFLGTKSLAAARLACRALRDVATGHQFVKVKLAGWFTAKVPASARVLTLMHSHESMLARVKDTKKPTTPKGASRNALLRSFVQSEYLASVAREVLALEVGPSWCAKAPDVDRLDNSFIVPGKMHASLSRMPLLSSVRLDGSLDVPAVLEMGDLRRLSCVEVAELPKKNVIKLMCQTLALTRLDLGRDQKDSWGSGTVPASVSPPWQYHAIIGHCTRLTGLRDLSLPCPASVVERLGALTGLTALTVRMWGVGGSLGGFTALTALERLRIEALDCNLEVARFESLSPVTALSRLTSLAIASGCSLKVCDDEREVSQLSRLTGLRELRYDGLLSPDFGRLEDHVLPTQFDVFKSATALETLHLEFCVDFWEVMDQQALHALRAALCGLPSLKDVRLEILPGSEDGEFYKPLVAFTGAPSVQTLHYAFRDDDCEDFSERARECLTALTGLRDLRVGHVQADRPVPSCVDLLMGLPSNHLTSLVLKVQSATGALMQQIARFGDLQELKLVTEFLTVGSFGPLFGLSELTCLEIQLQGRSMQELHGGTASAAALRAHAGRLKSTILESARLLGLEGRVKLPRFQ